MTRMIDILEDYCIYRSYGYCRIDGNTSGEDRESQIDDYNRVRAVRWRAAPGALHSRPQAAD